MDSSNILSEGGKDRDFYNDIFFFTILRNSISPGAVSQVIILRELMIDSRRLFFLKSAKMMKKILKKIHDVLIETKRVTTGPKADGGFGRFRTS